MEWWKIAVIVLAIGKVIDWAIVGYKYYKMKK